MMLRTALMALACLAAACAPTTADTTSQEPPVGNNAAVPAPTPDDVAVKITAAQNGQTVNVRIGQRFAVELVGVPTAGYAWTPAVVPAFVTRAGEATGNTTAAQSQPGFVGGNHWEVLMFAATGPGTGELRIEQRRPWETGDPVATFTVTIVAQ